MQKIDMTAHKGFSSASSRKAEQCFPVCLVKITEGERLIEHHQQNKPAN